ncbi:biopolymer transporter ExbB [Moraxella osloensis]|uniref:Biopolymer transport protein ExbB n=1 Tax=Faucicola osloensis TaxID=34062 RepID=A0A378QBD4_FAUOS|nr:MotA/TolQ/ExbB proton channel family protein [Moraxella osloensis]AME01921.1 biopolymer transporter ExbB [Moraxella osloensis]OBX57457.1 biopolymer transporter ExbB [Moraxella osloensis]QPT42336.1 MotA/TolQ/ExbB proton channel family protein [Moraxella osloensis]STY97982.1 Biopolymer transport protein exbB [Moraxella osloensis]
MDFANYWQYTDVVTKTLFFVLIVLSMLSWITGILRILNSQKIAKTVSQDLTQKIHQQQSQLTTLSLDNQKLVTEQQLLQQLNRYRFASEQGLNILGTTAAIAPFIGLFGTVWGIFHALDSIAKSGQAGLGQVAGPVGEALIMTGLGLAVAIPAVIMYNVVVRINRKAMHQANDTAHTLLANVLMNSSSQVTQTSLATQPHLQTSSQPQQQTNAADLMLKKA